MSYPLSSAVVEGQATEAAQYNNLRSDALCLGGDPAASGLLRDLLIVSMGNIDLSQNGANSIILAASEDVPASVVINGSIYTVTSSLSFSMDSESYPLPGYYMIFASARVDGTFALGVGSVIPSGCRQIGGLAWTGSGIVRGSVRNSATEAIYAAKNPFICNGRLTYVSMNPIPDEEISMANTLFFTPYNGNEVSLYVGGRWMVFNYSELSLNISSLSRMIPYDIFISADSSGLFLMAQIWGSDSSRAFSLIRQDGILVSADDRSKRYVGTICKNANGYGTDTKESRLLYNEYNQVPRPILSKLITSKNQGSIHLDTWAPYYDEDAPIVWLLTPNNDSSFELHGVGISSPISETDRQYVRYAAVGISKDCRKESPYTENYNICPVFTHTFGNGPMTVDLYNYSSELIGVHEYCLTFYSNYNFYPVGNTNNTSIGETPGLYGIYYG